MDKNFNQEDKSTVDTAVEKLKASPIFAMSLGSKELFHSNFWAWIFKKYPQFLKTFFPDIDIDASGDIKREQGNRDITIWNKDKTLAYVIENKLKSMPNLQQLADYEGKLNRQFAGGVLTGIIEPMFALPSNWRFVSYQQVCKSVLDIAESLSEGLDKIMLLEYAETLQSMFEVICAYSQSIASSFPCWDVTGMENELNDIKLWDICQKFQANRFLEVLNKVIQEKLKLKIKLIEDNIKFKFDLHMNFTRGAVLVDCGFMRDHKGASECAIGIQIQNGQYRKYAKRRGSEFRAENVYGEFKNYGWFTKKADMAETKMQNNYCKYEEKSDLPYRFIYQYTTIKDNSFEYLNSCIIKDLIEIMEMIENQAL